jgi:AraC-like DNA-binding protein
MPRLVRGRRSVDAPSIHSGDGVKYLAQTFAEQRSIEELREHIRRLRDDSDQLPCPSVAFLNGAIAAMKALGAPIDPVARSSIGTECPPHICEALRVIASQYRDVKCVTTLARRLRCHRVYLARSFGTSCGVGVSRYLRAFKLGVACTHLHATDVKISCIPELAGFGSQATLWRAFVSATGRTPSGWRHVKTKFVF